MERRLAVILAADVVGYSALMERDEAGTFTRLKAGRKELFEPEIERHHGRISLDRSGKATHPAEHGAALAEIQRLRQETPAELAA